jgi:hypothetical protein
MHCSKRKIQKGLHARIQTSQNNEGCDWSRKQEHLGLGAKTNFRVIIVKKALDTNMYVHIIHVHVHMQFFLKKDKFG